MFSGPFLSCQPDNHVTHKHNGNCTATAESEIDILFSADYEMFMQNKISNLNSREFGFSKIDIVQKLFTCSSLRMRFT